MAKSKTKKSQTPKIETPHFLLEYRKPPCEDYFPGKKNKNKSKNNKQAFALAASGVEEASKNNSAQPDSSGSLGPNVQSIRSFAALLRNPSSDERRSHPPPEPEQWKDEDVTVRRPMEEWDDGGECQEWWLDEEKKWKEKEKRWKAKEKRWQEEQKRWKDKEKRWKEEERRMKGEEKRWEEEEERWKSEEKRWEEAEELWEEEREWLYHQLIVFLREENSGNFSDTTDSDDEFPPTTFMRSFKSADAAGSSSGAGKSTTAVQKQVNFIYHNKKTRPSLTKY